MVWLLVEYGNYFMLTHFEVRHLLDGRRLFQFGHPKGRRLLEEMRYSEIVAGISYISFVLKDSKKN